MTSATTVRRTSRHVSITALQPWYSQLTLDLCISALSKSIFHPFIACLLPLCLRALAAPYHSTSFVLTSAFAAAICAYHVLAIVNQRVAYGRPREIDWEREVVVITGGLGGLGGCITEIYGLRGVSVAVMDVGVPKELDGQEKEGINYYRCDIADPQNMKDVWMKILEDLGTPTILINNAAVIHSSPFLKAEAEEIDQVFRVNTLSHFHLTQHFLRTLLKSHRGGTLVTMSSVLGHLGAANLSAYTASKAALLAYHSSLSAELASTAPQIKTILVAPGQLDTQPFSHIHVQGWLQNFVGPVVGAGELAVRVVEMIDQGLGGEVRMPEFAKWVGCLGVLPMGLQRGLRWWSGLDTAMGYLGQDEEKMESEDNKTIEVNGADSDTEEDTASEHSADDI
ncbi:MAG: hypothetical protein Q9164_006133 [Protoblastenia rupestris]